MNRMQTIRNAIRTKLKDRSILGQISMYVLSIIIVLIVWQVASVIIETVKGRAFLPTPIRAMAEVIRLGPMLFRNFWINLSGMRHDPIESSKMAI